jgi:hypothetical protein
MKLRWGWMLAIAVLCLLWSLNPAASLNPVASFDKHLVAWSAQSCSPSSYPSLPVLTQDCIRSREGPKLFLTPDVLLRTEDLGPEGPPWLELRGPPGKYRGSRRPAGLLVAKVATAALQRGENYPKLPLPGEFFRPPAARNQNPGFCNSL